MNDPSRSPPARIGYLLKMFPRLSETFILNEILELEQQGLELHIFSLKRPADAVTHAQAKLVRAPVTYLAETFQQAPIRTSLSLIHVYLRYRRPWRKAMRQAVRRARAEGDMDAFRSLCQACCLIREMGEIQHLHAHYANVPARLALIVHRLTGASYSITTHAKDIFLGDPLVSPKLHERISKARFVVANSRFSADHIRARVPSQTEIHAVYNGLALSSFPMRTRIPTEPIILSVGRLVEKKGFCDLIEACRLLRERRVQFACELIGTGRLSAALKDQIRSSGLADCVKMVGPLPQEVLRTHYERAMVFALPCIQSPDGDRDILPNVIKESMAVGVPVVTTRLDGIEELIEDGLSGLLVEPGDAPNLAVKLEMLLRDLDLRGRLAAQARKVIEQRFDRRSTFSQLKTLLVKASGNQQLEPAQQAPVRLNPYDASCLR